VLEHYTSAIRDIRSRGLYASLQATSRPYIKAVWSNFSPKKTTLTEDLFTGRLFSRAWNALRRRFRRANPS
jgi:hypothetical protein